MNSGRQTGLQSLFDTASVEEKAIFANSLSDTDWSLVVSARKRQRLESVQWLVFGESSPSLGGFNDWLTNLHSEDVLHFEDELVVEAVKYFLDFFEARLFMVDTESHTRQLVSIDRFEGSPTEKRFQLISNGDKKTVYCRGLFPRVCAEIAFP